MGTFIANMLTQLDRGSAGLDAGFGLFAGCVYLDVYVQFLVVVCLRFDAFATALFELGGFFQRVDAGHAEEVGDVAGQGFAFVGLERADEVPADWLGGCG